MSAMPSKNGSPTVVMIPPANPARSNSSVFAPRRAAASVAARPAQPPPQTSTSTSRCATGGAALARAVAATSVVPAAPRKRRRERERGDGERIARRRSLGGVAQIAKRSVASREREERPAPPATRPPCEAKLHSSVRYQVQLGHE